MAATLVIAAAGGIAFLYAYWTNAGNLFLGMTLAVALGACGAGLVLWAHYLMKNETVAAPREALDSGDAEQDALFEDLMAGEQRIERRRLLGWMAAGVVSILTAGFLSVLRSLGTDPTPVLKKPVWKRGDLLVNAEGNPVLVDTLDLRSVITVYPQGRVGSVGAETLLLRVDETLLHLPEERAGWAPKGNLAFSRICTHAGCPVALYEAKQHLLLCPCHQSTFNVLAAAAPTSGPAARALPQLPLYVDNNRYLRAGGDFTESPGPGFWNLPS